MATRFYFPVNGSLAPVNPPLSSIWNIVPATPVRRLGVRAKTNTAMLTQTDASTDTVSAVSNAFWAQYVTAPLAAQTITGTLRGVVRVIQAAAATDAFLQLVVRVVSADGQTVRGTLYGGSSLNTVVATAGAINQEFPTSSTTRVLPDTNVTSVTVQDGDRLVYELGARFTNTVATSYTAGWSRGDPTAADLAFDTTTTTNTAAPWIEFSQAILYQGEGGTPPGSDSVNGDADVLLTVDSEYTHTASDSGTGDVDFLLTVDSDYEVTYPITGEGPIDVLLTVDGEYTSTSSGYTGTGDIDLLSTVESNYTASSTATGMGDADVLVGVDSNYTTTVSSAHDGEAGLQLTVDSNYTATATSAHTGDADLSLIVDAEWTTNGSDSGQGDVDFLLMVDSNYTATSTATTQGEIPLQLGVESNYTATSTAISDASVDTLLGVESNSSVSVGLGADVDFELSIDCDYEAIAVFAVDGDILLEVWLEANTEVADPVKLRASLGQTDRYSARINGQPRIQARASARRIAAELHERL